MICKSKGCDSPGATSTLLLLSPSRDILEDEISDVAFEAKVEAVVVGR